MDSDSVANPGLRVDDDVREQTHVVADLTVATDMAAEGLNLQRAGVVIHYDLPWNPVKLDQRNGRAHRIGQRRAEVRAVYFLPQADRTGIVQIMTSKNRDRRRTLQSCDGGRPARPSCPWPCTTTLPRRLTRDAAAVRMIRLLERQGIPVAQSIERHHKAGLERLIEAMTSEYLDQQRIERLFAALASETGDVPAPAEKRPI